ncbi:MAG: apolipoprotein A1/A4/E family protein [Mogibacterium sp.]|nr:apolipoprotein A1/A4/E family protein [Mogibacterium sp.]
MAEKKTVDKVKELLESNAYAPLKEAAEKWLVAADEKYGDKIDELKEKAAPAIEKLGEAADKYSDFAIDANEKLADVSEKVSAKADEFAEKAGPAFEEFKEKAAPVIEDLKEKAAPTVDQIKEKAAPTVDQLKEKAAPAIDKISDSEFIAKLKDGISTLSDNIAFFSSDAAKEKFGEEAADQIRKHAEEMKAQGKTYCDCPACTKAREILRDLGVELEEPEAE